MRSRGAVCMLARAPSVPGKTRLCAGLSDDRAIALRRALFLDTLEAARASGCPVLVYYTPATAREEFGELLTTGEVSVGYGEPAVYETPTTYGTPTAQGTPMASGDPPTSADPPTDGESITYGGPGLPRPERSRRQSRPTIDISPALFPQSDGDLGARMHAAVVDAFACGFDRVILIGSDLPTLPPAHLVDALAALDRARVVLGPAEDGGYYLVGLRKPRPEIFKGIAWGTADVLQQTLTIAHRLDLIVELAPTWHDVDIEADLRRVSSSARHTFAWVMHSRMPG